MHSFGDRLIEKGSFFKMGLVLRNFKVAESLYDKRAFGEHTTQDPLH